MTYDDGEILLKCLAGVGIFFFGIKMITQNLSALAGDQFRRGLHNASRHRSIAMLLGATTGFVTQSGRTTSFIMASFVQAGLIEVQRALPIVLWANFGCVLVIFTAVLPINLIVLLLLAVTGISIAFEKPKSMLDTASTIFGLALMLFGLQMMSSSAATLTSYHAFASALALIETSLLFAFLIGLGLTLIAQSHIAITLIALTMATRQIFDFDQTLMVIYGAHTGASLITHVTGIHFKGRPRQLVIAQVLYNLSGVGLFLALFIGEHALFGRSLLEEQLRGLTSSTGGQAALVTALLNTLTPILLTAILPLYYRLCVRLAPPLGVEDLARPQYLREEVGDNAMATLLLAEKEQLRLLQRLPAYCSWIRGDDAARGGPSPSVYQDAFAQISKAIARFQNALMSLHMSLEDTEWLLNQQKRQDILGDLYTTCHELTEVSGDMQGEAERLRDVIVESLDAMLLTAISGFANNDREELATLATMTRNRGPAMERMRKRYLAVSDQLPPDERNRVLQITSLFERGAWSLQRFGVLLAETPDFGVEGHIDQAGSLTVADKPVAT